MTLTEYINKTSDILTNIRDKNPLFYMFVVAKMKSGSETEDLKNDFTLKQLFQQVEILSKQLGKENIAILNSNWSAGIVMIRFNESLKKKTETVLRDMLKDMKNLLMCMSLEFSKAYEIDQAFDQLTNSKEYIDFINTL